MSIIKRLLGMEKNIEDIDVPQSPFGTRSFYTEQRIQKVRNYIAEYKARLDDPRYGDKRDAYNNKVEELRAELKKLYYGQDPASDPRNTVINT